MISGWRSGCGESEPTKGAAVPRVPEEVRRVKVDSLALDLSNFRFAVDQSNESLAFNYLFEEYDVLGMARSLLREGYTTNELPLVVEENSRFVVLEANRRVSALRALRDPSLAPAYRQRIEALLKRHQEDADELPDEIYVTVFPDRKTAAPILARQHIGEDKKRWGLDEQAKFVLAQLTDEVDVKYLKETLTGIKDVVRLIRMGRVREALLSTNFTDADIAAFAAGQELKMSVFEYAYRSREIQPLMGFSFDQDGNVTSRPESPGQIAVLERVLRGFQSGELSTRRVLDNKKGDAYKELVEELKAILDPPTQSEVSTSTPSSSTPVDDTPSGANTDPHGSGTAKQPSSPSSNSETTTDGQQPQRGPNHPDTRDKLSLQGIDQLPVPEAFAARLHELRSISLKSHPTAATMLLRSVIEAAIKEHFAQRGTTVSGELGRAVDAVFRAYPKERQISQAVQLLKNARGPIAGSGEWFNAPTHSMHVTITAPEIHQAWREMLPLLRFLLSPAQPATP